MMKQARRWRKGVDEEEKDENEARKEEEEGEEANEVVLMCGK